ncbi:MAG TPA: SCO family protein [Aestuariivirga sp.]|nr:SCO family protein [Aestuariivirga sp.]
MPSRSQALIAAVILLLALVIGATALVFQGGGKGPISIGEALIGGPFSLTDQNGRRVSEKDFLGKYMLVFFGYTYCPDICPTELQVMTEALREMGPRADAIQPVFISFDPERDTPETLKAYVENFSPRLIGLTGSEQEIARAAKAYRVYYRKVEGGGATDYLMDHSSIIYLMGPNGKFVRHFSYSTDAKALAEALASAIAS